MNWTGGTLNRHSHNYNSNRFSGKSYRNRSQAFAQRQHFARLRKRKGIGRDLDGHGHEHGYGAWRAFVPDWETGLQRGIDGIRGDEVEENFDDEDEDDDDDDDDDDDTENKKGDNYCSADCGGRMTRNTGRIKTLKEFEELLRVEEQGEREKGKEKEKESLKWMENKSQNSGLVTRRPDGEDYLNYYHGIMCDDRDESVSDSEARGRSDVHYTGEGDEELAHRMEFLLHHDDWAGLKNCRVDTDCLGRNRSLGCHSKAIFDESMSTSMNRYRKRKRQDEDKEFQPERDILKNADRTFGKRYEKLNLKANYRLSRSSHSKFAQPSLPMQHSLYRDKWHQITKPDDIGKHINDDDISIRIGSNALRSENSNSSLSGRVMKTQSAEVTESDEKEADDEDEDRSYESLTEEYEDRTETDKTNRNLYRNNKSGLSGVFETSTMSSEPFPLASEINHISFERRRTPWSEDSYRSLRKRKRLKERQRYNEVDIRRYEDSGESNCSFNYYEPYHDTLRNIASKEDLVNDNEDSDTPTIMTDTCSLYRRQMSSSYRVKANPIGETNDNVKLLMKVSDGISTQEDDNNPNDSFYTNEANCKDWPWLTIDCEQ